MDEKANKLFKQAEEGTLRCNECSFDVFCGDTFEKCSEEDLDCELCTVFNQLFRMGHVFLMCLRKRISLLEKRRRRIMDKNKMA